MNNLKIYSYKACKYLLTVIVSLMMSQITMAADSDDWDYMVEAYILATNIEGDLGIGRVANAEVDIDFIDILEALKLAGMFHAEAFHKNTWGLIFDYGFMKLEDDKLLRFGGSIETEIRQGVMEMFLARRFVLDKGHVDIFAGMRWWDNDIDADVNTVILPGSATINIDENWVDPVIGVRWFNPISDKWTLQLRGDIGGFGVASDSTWKIGAGAKYKIKENWILDMQYVGTWVDYEDGTPGIPGSFAYDTVTHGPLLGIIYDF